MQITALRINGLPNGGASLKVGSGLVRVYTDADSKFPIGALLQSFASSENYEATTRSVGAANAVLRLQLAAQGSRLALERNQSNLRAKLQSPTESGAASDDETLVRWLIDAFDAPLPEDWRDAYIWSPKAARHQQPVEEIGSDESELKRELQTLQEEHMMLSSMSSVQTQADELQNRSFEIEHRQTELGNLLGRFDDLNEKLERYGPIIRGGKVLANQARNYDQLVEQFEKRSYKHEIKMERLNERLAEVSLVKLWHRDPKLYGVALLFFGSLIGSSVLKNQLVAIPAILALGGLAYLISVYLKGGKALAEARQEVEDATRGFAAKSKAHQEAVGHIEELQIEYKLLSPADVAKLVDESDALQQELMEFESKNSLASLRKEQEEITAEKNDIDQKFEKLSQALSEASGGMNNLRELENRIQALQAKLRGEAAPATATGSSVEWYELDRLESLQKAQSAIVRVSRTSESSLFATAETKTEEWLPKLTANYRKYNYNDAVVETTTGEYLGLHELPEDQQRILMIVARVALYAVMPPDRRFPAVWIEPFLGLSDDVGLKLMKLLNIVGKAMQFVVITSSRALAPAGASTDMVFQLDGQQSQF